MEGMDEDSWASGAKSMTSVLVASALAIFANHV